LKHKGGQATHQQPLCWTRAVSCPLSCC